MGSLEERMARLEGALAEISKRLNHLEDDLRDLRRDIRWIIGILITMWITIILTILFKP
ncbi:MAG: hemolysin XhlA [Candidatus Bathyarchaeota archaeon BA2]|nr:MAG: hemolysin XhlA [Candidatus Bathyarchaeota archaeon BA2]